MPTIDYKIQIGDSLGSRMAETLISSLALYSKVIIVGSDCPNVSAKTIEEACIALNNTDLVIQPAEDGGYVLIGTRHFDARIFDGVAWGQGQVLKQTLANAGEIGLTYTLLDESWDVDDYEDYMRWQDTIQGK